MGSQISKSKATKIEEEISSHNKEVTEFEMKMEEGRSKRKRAPTKAFVPEESKKRMRVSNREKGKVRYKDTASHEASSEEEEEYEVKFIVEDRFVKGKRQFKVRWVNYGPKDDSWVDEADMSCPKIVADYEKSKEAEAEDDDDDEGEDYEVEECLDWRMVGGKREFFIKWKNFSARSNTWEPEANLDCPALIKKCLDKKKEKASPAKKATPKSKPGPKSKKAAKKGAAKPKRSLKKIKNGNGSEEEEEKEDEEEAEEAEAADDKEETKEEEEEHKDEAEAEEADESKNDADDEDEEKEEKVEDKRRSKPGPKSKKRK